MKNYEETHYAENQVLMSINKPPRPTLPKLRKNKRVDQRWGEKYYNLIRDAVFLLRKDPVIPAALPMSLRYKDDYDPVHLCKECGDCFRFQSSLEDHNSRRSWMLAYWCHNCFFTECFHEQKGQTPCFECQRMNRHKKISLKFKGLRKGRKLGCTKIFYNQCQFFAHLKNHRTTYVDMSDVMLMPLPSNIDKEYYDQLESLCGTIMERMFLTRTHIMDWLKSQQLDNNWWKSFLKYDSDYCKNKLTEMFAATGMNRGRKKSANQSVKIHKPDDTCTVSPGASSPGSSSVTLRSRSNTPSSISETIESVIAQSIMEEPESPTQNEKLSNPPPLLAAFINPQEPVEGDDNPCTMADIAFVDCGPAAKTYPPDVGISLLSKDNLKIKPTGNKLFSNIVEVLPPKREGRQIIRTSKSPLILKRSRVHNIVHTVSSSAPLAVPRPTHPKISVKKFANESLQSSPATRQKNSLQLTNQKLQPLKKLAPAPSIRTSGPNTSMPSVMEIARAVETSKNVVAQASLSSFGSKILTVHGPKNADLSKIISQLPPDVINGKKLVFIGQDSERFPILPKTAGNSGFGMIKIQSEPDKLKIVKNLSARIPPVIVSNVDDDQTVKLLPNTSEENSKSKIQQLYLDGKVIHENGKRFIIRPARKPIQESTLCNSINDLKLPIIPKRVSLSSFLSKSINAGAKKVPVPLTSSVLNSCPSPSTSKDPKESEFTIQMRHNGNSTNNVEKKSDCSTSDHLRQLRNYNNSDAIYFSIKTDKDGKSYVDFTSKKGPSTMQVTANHNYKQQMLERFSRLGEGRKNQYMDHLIKINQELEKMADIVDDGVISKNFKAMENLAIAFARQSPCPDEHQHVDEGSSVDAIRKILSEMKETRKPLPICPTCNRSIDMESHIVQFSKGIDQNLGCYNCNNCICYICDVFQGNMSRFEAHLKFHAKEEPFTCPECFRKFPSFQRLEVHTWTNCFHPLTRRWFQCKICDVEGFPDMDSVTEHFILAHSRLEVACPECGLRLKSKTDFEKHRVKDHPKATEHLKPIKFIECDVGRCVVPIENYRTHMDHHIAVTNMLYYKCPFCSFVVQNIKHYKEQIKSHLFTKHLEQLSGLISPESLHDVTPVEYLVKRKHLKQLDNRSKVVTELEQDFDVLSSVSTDDGMMIKEIVSTSESDEPYEHADAKLNKQTLKDGIKHSTWSVNLGHSKLRESLETTTQEKVVNTPNHVLSGTSSSPKIFDVRSVTPHSYAKISGGTKEQIDVITCRENDMSALMPENLAENSEAQPGNSILLKMGKQIRPIKLPHSVPISQSILKARNSSNIELLDSTKSDERTDLNNTVELLKKLGDRKSDVPPTEDLSASVTNTVHALAPEQYRKIAVNSKSCQNLLKTVQLSPTTLASVKHQAAPVSLLKVNNHLAEKIVADINKTNNQEPELKEPVPTVNPFVASNTGTDEGRLKDALLCIIPKPPPLARIPQRLLELSQNTDEVEEEEPHDQVRVTAYRSPVKSRQKHKRPWRIALNEPLCNSEVIDYNCHLCGEPTNTCWSEIQDHFGAKHSHDYKLSIVTPRLLRMSDDFIFNGYKEVLGPRKRKSDGIASSSKRRRRWNPKKHFEKHLIGPGLCVQQESVQDGEGNFICKKCDLQCNDISSLRTHIGTNHRIKDHYLVCLECGENFVVEPSLQMHLKAFHCIQDPCKYMEQNTEYVKKMTETIEDEGKTGIANQCHVCMAVFEDKAAVDKHLRVHGMAFLNRKRIEAQNAARNPEKKIKIDNPDDGLAVTVSKNDDIKKARLCETVSLNEESKKAETKNTSS